MPQLLNAVQPSIIQRLIETFSPQPVTTPDETKRYAAWIATDPQPTHKRTFTKIFDKTCVICGTPFEAKKSNAKCCSGVCRVALCRRRKKAQQTLDKILWLTGDLQSMAEGSGDIVLTARARSAMATLKDDIIQACRETKV